MLNLEIEKNPIIIESNQDDIRTYQEDSPSSEFLKLLNYHKLYIKIFPINPRCYLYSDSIPA